MQNFNNFMDIKPKGKKQKVRRYYDKLAELLPEFRPTKKLVSNVFSIVDHTKRGVTHSLRRPKTPKIEENFNGEFTDYDYQRVLEMSQNSHFSKPFLPFISNSVCLIFLRWFYSLF